MDTAYFSYRTRRNTGGWTVVNRYNYILDKINQMRIDRNKKQFRYLVGKVI